MIESNYKKQTIKQLLYDFFYNFSRFEYALKASGYFRARSSRHNPPNYLNIEPDWNSFIQSLPNVFQMDQNEELRKACQYILNYPPRKQVVFSNSITWIESVKGKDESDIIFLLRMVKCIRNNLFHGAKHNIQPHHDSQRTELLLQSGLVILKECLKLNIQLKQEYNQAVL